MPGFINYKPTNKAGGIKTLFVGLNIFLFDSFCSFVLDSRYNINVLESDSINLLMCPST